MFTVARAPSGSLIYQAEVVGSIVDGTDEDRFTVSLGAGQSLSAVMTRTADSDDLLPDLRLIGPDNSTINAVSGEEWREGAHRDPQDYVVVPGQPWLDGYCVKKGEIAQFVAMPLGEGYTAEEQITGEAEFGGLQIMVYPMKAEEWEKIKKARQAKSRIRGKGPLMMMECCSVSFEADMGLAPGGRMKQDIEKDPYDLSVWDLRNGSRVFVHLANSLAWRAIT